MNISKTHYYEKGELKQLINELECTPMEYVTDTLMDWLETKNKGEYLINILSDEDIRALSEYMVGDEI